MIVAVAGVLSLTSCSNEYSTDWADAGSITIQATIGQMTKVENKGNATNFTDGDKILLYGWTGSDKEIPATRVVDSVVNSFDGTVWTPAKQMNWKNATDAHYFLGICPVPDSVTSFTAAAYKLNPAEYESSDLLIATNLNGVTVADGPVNLTFEHAMAKLNVNLKFRSEFSANTIVSSVTATAYDSATVNYLTKEVTPAGTATAVTIPAATTQAPQGYALSFSGLMVPQDGVKKITVTIGNQIYVYESSNGIPLNAGKYTTIGLIVGQDKIELEGATVTDWTAGDNLPGGEAKLQDPYNGHEYVDLGLKVKWATCNVGTTNPVLSGDFFAWGETETKNIFTLDSYTLTKYNATDNKITLDLEDDAAHAKWGGSWRMPTKAEWDELMNDNNCTWVNNSNGFLVTSKSNGNSIFLPIVGRYNNSDYDFNGDIGFYWSSSLYTDDPSSAWYLLLKSDDYSGTKNYIEMKADKSRKLGFSIRPVCP